MARYTGPKNRLSRREGVDLFGKGTKLRRSTVPPGQHGPKGTRRVSDYGAQLREKQKAKRIYGLTEKQFHRTFVEAARHPGNTGEIFFTLLETRLDNVVFRLGFVPTRAMARQIVGHRHILVNGQIVNIPSYRVRLGDVITPGSNIQLPVSENPSLPAWVSRQGPAGRVDRVPQRSDIDTSIHDQLIVEYYSR